MNGANQYSLERSLSVWLSLSVMLHGGHSHRIDREVYCPQHTVGSTCWSYTLPALYCQAYTCFQQNYINVQCHLSQSWLDSICRDSMDTKYMKIQTFKISNSKLILYNNVLFILMCFHNEQHAQWYKKYQKPESPRDQNFFSCSEWLVHCVHDCFCTNSSILQQCTSP